MIGLLLSKRTAVVAGAVLTFFGSCISNVYAQSISDRVLKEGKITIGIHNRSPWGFKGADNQVTGFHPDLVRAVLGPLGIKEIDFVIAEFPALIPSLMSKRIDAIASGMAVTPARCEQVIFSNPDLAIKDTLVVKPGNPLNIHSFADIAKNADIRLATLRGSTQVDNAVKAGIAKDRILLFQDYGSLVSALVAGRVEALILTTAAAIDILKDPNLKGQLERATPFVGLVEEGREAASYTAVEFRTEDAKLRDLYNEELEKRKADGTVKKIAAKYDFTDAELAPENLTAKALCPNNYR